MKKYVKVTSILLFTMIVMLCTCVFASAEEYGVWVGGVQVTSDNAEDVLGDGTVSYDAVTSTLTLDNANITDCYHIVNYDNVMCYGLYFTHSLNLYVKGECNIVPECTDSLYEGFGISKGTDNISLTIYGDGKENVLTVCAPAAVNKSCGINMECCDITIRNLSVNAYGNRSENDSHGIYTLGTSTLIDGSVVYKYGGNLVIENADINSYGGDVASLTGKAVVILMFMLRVEMSNVLTAVPPAA